MTWDASQNQFVLTPVPTLPPSRCAVCQTQSGMDGPYGQALGITLVDGTPAVCRRCMVGLLALWGVVPAERFAEAEADRDEARAELGAASVVRDEALRSVERLEAALAAKQQETHDLERLLRGRDAQIKAAHEGRLGVPDVDAIVAQVREALLEQPPPAVKAKRPAAVEKVAA